MTGVNGFPAWSRALAQQAARARIAEIGRQMDQAPAGTATATGGDGKDVARTMWAAGDYHRFATSTIWELGPVLVAACGVGSGQRVLDVAAGSGNAAIRAAEEGAEVVASDLTTANFEAGRREARARGVELGWVEADAEALPFDDGEFDTVLSLFGAIFAPDHQRVADEMLRVCRPGGTVGMLTFTPEGVGGAFFDLFGPYAPPPPPGALPVVLWGDQDHVRALFGDRVTALEMTRRTYVERAASPQAYADLFTETFGPVVALRSNLPDDRRAAFDRDLLDFARRMNTGPAGGPAEYPYGYLRVVARTRLV